VTDDVTEALQRFLKTFAFANYDSAWQMNASSRLTLGRSLIVTSLQPARLGTKFEL
jgi:hypothetical protein